MQQNPPGTCLNLSTPVHLESTAIPPEVVRKHPATPGNHLVERRRRLHHSPEETTADGSYRSQKVCAVKARDPHVKDGRHQHRVGASLTELPQGTA